MITLTDDKTYDVHIHSTPYKTKPTNIPSINNTITNQQTAVTQRQFAKMVGEQGHTTVLGLMDGKRSKENLVSQEIVAIDFDNADGKKKSTGSRYTSIEDILNDPYAKQHASFLYKTFSHKDDWHRFRLVFFLDVKLIKNEHVELLYKWLMNKYPNADKANKDSSRMFFGGTEVIEINFGNELDTDEVTVDPKDVEQVKQPEYYPKNIQKLKHEDAQNMFSSYLEREADNLKDYDNALSALWVIGKAAKTGEISFPAAYQFAEQLAMGDSEWEDNNREKLKECLNLPIHEIRTNYSFAQKFGKDFSTATLDRGDLIQTSKYLVEQLDIKLYKGSLYFKTGNHWISDDNKLLRAVDEYIELKSSQDKEILNQFSKRSELIESEQFPIQFRNDYHLENGIIKKGYTQVFTPYYLDVDFVPDAYNADVDNFLDFLTCDRNDLRQVIIDMLGHVLMTQGFPHKVFFFIGQKGGNGKSTFLEMLNSFAGELATNISLENFTDATSVVDLEGRLVNIGDDIDATYLEKTSNFKILASGNTLKVRPIYTTPYQLKNKATLIFTANDMPSFKDKTGGIARRLVIIPCDNTVKKADLSIDSKLSTENAKSYLLNLAIKGMYSISDNGGKISYSQTIEDRTNAFLIEDNTALMYIAEVGIDQDLPDKSVYSDYYEFATDNGSKPFSKSKFTQILQEQGYTKTRQMRMGKRRYYYIKNEE